MRSYTPLSSYDLRSDVSPIHGPSMASGAISVWIRKWAWFVPIECEWACSIHFGVSIVNTPFITSPVILKNEPPRVLSTMSLGPNPDSILSFGISLIPFPREMTSRLMAYEVKQSTLSHSFFNSKALSSLCLWFLRFRRWLLRLVLASTTPTTLWSSLAASLRSLYLCVPRFTNSTDLLRRSFVILLPLSRPLLWWITTSRRSVSMTTRVGCCCEYW